MDHIATPFGRRTLSLGMVAAQVAAREVDGKVAHKWKTFSAIAESKDVLGVSDRSLAVLNALLTFIPETALCPGQLVVFASNNALAVRAHGMAEGTLRRHLNALVEAGLVIRRDSPNGKRYARRDGAGSGSPTGSAPSDTGSGVSEWPILTPTEGGFNATFTADREKTEPHKESVETLEDVGRIIQEQMTKGTVNHPVLLALHWGGGHVDIDVAQIAATMHLHDAWGKVVCSILFDSRPGG